MLSFLLSASFPECGIRFHRNGGNSAAESYSLRHCTIILSFVLFCFFFFKSFWSRMQVGFW